MFAPILANFLHIIFIIFGLFGAYQFRGKYLASVSFTLSLVWFFFFMAFGKESNFCAKNSIWIGKCKISFMLLYTWKNMVVIPATTFEIALSCDAVSIVFFSFSIPLIQLSSTLAIPCQNINDLQLLSARAKSDFTVFMISPSLLSYRWAKSNSKKINCNVADISRNFLSHCPQLKLYQYLPLTFAHAFTQYICQLSTKELTEFLISALR